LNGNHEAIRKFRRQIAFAKTARLRPDLLARIGSDGSSRELKRAEDTATPESDPILADNRPPEELE
jgi:tRNA G37 N-methylase TrmD